MKSKRRIFKTAHFTANPYPITLVASRCSSGNQDIVQCPPQHSLISATWRIVTACIAVAVVVFFFTLIFGSFTDLPGHVVVVVPTQKQTLTMLLPWPRVVPSYHALDL
jgi:hypothetical protein